MNYCYIKESMLLPGRSVAIYYREIGQGIPLVFLHGGWGYEAYPFDEQVQKFAHQLRIFIPDRTGYGRSMRVTTLPKDFHRLAAREMIEFLDAMGIEQAILWGHSDGAVIATMMALLQPGRFLGLILEAFHYYRRKNESQKFFEIMAYNPEQLGEKVWRGLAREHGEDYWETITKATGNAWLQLGRDSKDENEDLYERQFSELTTPSIFIFGSNDPRTETNEIDAVLQNLPHAAIHVIRNARHSPHSETAASSECNDLVDGFLRKLIATVKQKEKVKVSSVQA